MTWTVKRKITRPNTDVEFVYYEVVSAQPRAQEAAAIASGKLINIDSEVSSNELEQIKTFVFKDQAARDEWRSDSRTQARVLETNSYNTANNITIVELQNEET